MYVLVRRDLPNTQPAVQAGHALAEYLIQYPVEEWNNGTLVYLGVDNEEELLRWSDRLLEASITHSIFREPYYNDSATALAALCYCDKQILRKMLKDLPLL